MRSFLNLFSAAKAAPADDPVPYIFKSSGPVETVLILVIDVDPALLTGIMAAVGAKFGKSRKIIFITDSTDFTVFRENGFTFEYLPSLASQRLHSADMPWQAYLRERWSLLLAKWKPRLVLSYGMNIDTFLNAASGKPTPESDH